MTCRDLLPVDRLRPMSSIVIIEEDDLMRGLLTEWLTGAGYAVRERGLRRPPPAHTNTPPNPRAPPPSPADLIERVAKGDSEDPGLAPFFEDAVRDTIERFEAAGSPVVTDGEQRKYFNFATYCVHGLANTAPDGFTIPFADGHTRQLPRLTCGPFRYRRDPGSYLDVSMRHSPVS